MAETLIPSMHHTLLGERSGMRSIDINALNNTREAVREYFPDYRPESLYRLTTEEHQPLLSRIIDRVEANTNFFHEYREAGMIEGLQNGCDFEFPDARVIWDSEASRARNNHGHYEWDSDIHIADDKPNPLHILQSISYNGLFPESIQTLHHERIHAIQDPDYRSYPVQFWKFKKEFRFRDPTMFFAPIELIETQAFRTANYPAYLYSSSEVIDHIGGRRADGSSNYDVNPDQLPYTVDRFDAFNALGMTTDQIARMFIAPGDWCEEKQVYPDLEFALKNTLAYNNIDQNKLPLLKYAHTLEAEIDRIRAMTIIREEIQGKEVSREEAKRLEKTRRELAKLGIRQTH